MKNLEDIYIKLLGNPKQGDLSELDRHYRAIKADIESSKDSQKVDVSTIQRYGELHNAYLYLKTQWTLKRQQESGLILENLNLEKNKSKALTKKTNSPEYNTNSTTGEFLYSFHDNVKNIAKAGAIIVVCLFLVKLGIFLGKNNDVNASQQFVLKRPQVNEEQVPAPVDSPIQITQQEEKSSEANSKVAKFEPQVVKNNEPTVNKNLEDIQSSKKLLSTPTKVENIDKEIKIPADELELFRAAKSCSVSQLHEALSKVKNINQLDENGQTIAHWLCRMNCIAGMKWAVDNGINLNHKDKSGRTPLEWAKISSSLETIQFLNSQR